MSARVVHVDFVAWGASDHKQRRLCGTRAYVLRGKERDAAEAGAGLGVALYPPVTTLSHETSTDTDHRLPGMAAWLEQHTERR